MKENIGKRNTALAYKQKLNEEIKVLSNRHQFAVITRKNY